MPHVRTSFVLLGIPLLTATAAGAQGHPESVQRSLEDCREPRDGRARVCEVRALAAPRGTSALEIAAGTNGGVRVFAWDRDSIAVFALVQTWAEAREDAETLARGITVSAAGGRVRATEPARSRGSGHAVSYQVFAPRRTDITARTHNGSIALEGIAGRIDLEAVNGGLSLRRAGGDVRGRTRNGGIRLSLSGSRWEGRGIDLATTNGSVTVEVPERFDAALETATVNGHFSTDFPVTLQGRVGRELHTTLGAGGATIRATTRNGGVRIKRSPGP